MNRSEIYSTDHYRWCDHAESLLRARGLDFEEIDISQDPAVAQEMIERPGRYTVPQVFLDDMPVGGFDELSIIHLPDKPDGDRITTIKGGTQP